MLLSTQFGGMCTALFETPNRQTFGLLKHYLSRIVRKSAFCICENKDADQLRGNREADQRLCFRYIGSTIPQLPKSEISSLWPSSVAAQPDLCWTCRKYRRPVFSQRGSFYVRFKYLFDDVSFLVETFI